MPGGTFWVMNTICSVSAKRLSGIRSNTSRPTGIGGSISSGMILVGSSISKSKTVGEGLVEQLELQLPFRKIACFDRAPEIPAIKVLIVAVDLQGLVPQHRLQAKFWLPEKLYKSRF